MTNTISVKAYIDQVRNALDDRGDDGTFMRHTLHFAYPLDESASSLNEIISEYLFGNFGLTSRPTDDGAGLILEHHIAITGSDFDELTSKIRLFLSASRWEYDGWEWAVIQNDSINKEIH